MLSPVVRRGERIMVTGGAGFIGSHLAVELLKAGYGVVVVDNLMRGSRERVPSDAEFHQVDIRDVRRMQEGLRGVRAVYHLAAAVTVRGSCERFADDADINIRGTLRLFEAMRGGDVKRCVVASSMAVYADSAAGMKVGESHACRPQSPYGIGKLCMEQYAMHILPRLGVEPVVLRFFNTYGDRQNVSPDVGVVTYFTSLLAEGRRLPVYGDGRQCRDYIHVQDVCTACRLALSSGAGGRTFNVGTGHGTTVLDVVALLARRYACRPNIDFHPARPEELRNCVADISAAMEVLGFVPRHSLANDYVAAGHGPHESGRQA